MAEINITMRLFGAFRKYGESLTFAVPKGATPETVKERLTEKLGNGAAQLVRDSAIANEDEIMSDDAVLNGSCSLAILPPVCGG